MNLRHLEHLLALSQLGSFSRAAERMHITQSALSRSIQVLEDDLGGKLIDRVGKRNELTPLGIAVVERARRIAHEATELRRSVELLQQDIGGTLRVGLGSGPSALLMTPLLQYMGTRHPGLHLSISRGPEALQLAHLRARQVDVLVASLRGIAPAPDLAIELVSDLRACFLCRTGHPLAGQGPVPFAALAAYPLASPPMSEEQARIMTDHYGPQANPAQAVTLECEDLTSLLDTVEVTDAVFLGILTAGRPGIAAGRLVELQIEPPLVATARFGLVQLAGRTEGPAIRVLRQFVSERLHD